MAALVFPTALQAAAQTPLNTFSPTSTPLTNTSNTNTYTYDTGLGVWTASGAGGGSSVTAATLAEAATGTSNTVFSSPQTSVPKNASGMAGSAFMPAGNTAAQPAAATYTGQLRYNTQVPQWEYSDGATWLPLVSSSSLSAASLAEAAAGTSNTKYSSPQTAVPKDASGMTGAAIIPGGTDAQRAAIASPLAGMIRYNNQGGTPATSFMEWYNGATWSPSWPGMGGGGGNWQTFTSSGTWTKPSSGTMAWVFVWGGGAGGSNFSTGGGGGGCTPAFLQLSTLAATVSVTIGGGGASGVTGGSGGTSYFGTIGALGGGVTCQGLAPNGGPGTVPPFYPSLCGATNSDAGPEVWTPFSGGNAADPGNSYGLSGGSSYWGGGAGGSDYLPGRSVMGGTGATEFVAATAPGGGGYGGAGGATAGARGQVTVIVL